MLMVYIPLMALNAMLWRVLLTNKNITRRTCQGPTFLALHLESPKFVRLLFIYVLATSTVKQERVSTCDSAHSRRLYNAAWLGRQATSTQYSVTLSWHWVDQSFPYPVWSSVLSVRSLQCNILTDDYLCMWPLTWEAEYITIRLLIIRRGTDV